MFLHGALRLLRYLSVHLGHLLEELDLNAVNEGIDASVSLLAHFSLDRKHSRKVVQAICLLEKQLVLLEQSSVKLDLAFVPVAPVLSLWKGVDRGSWGTLGT